MSDFQKLLDQALEKVNLTPVDDTPEMEEYDIDVEVRDLVISARNAANLTQKQLAQRSGVSQANISKIENESRTHWGNGWWSVLKIRRCNCGDPY